MKNFSRIPGTEFVVVDFSQLSHTANLIGLGDTVNNIFVLVLFLYFCFKSISKTL